MILYPRRISGASGVFETESAILQISDELVGFTVNDVRCHFGTETSRNSSGDLPQPFVVQTNDRDFRESSFQTLRNISDFVIDRGRYGNLARDRLAGPLQEQIHAALAIENLFFNNAPESESFGNLFNALLNRLVLRSAAAEVGRYCWRFSFRWSGRPRFGRNDLRNRWVSRDG